MTVKLNPNIATIYPVGMDDNIVSGLKLTVDPNGLIMTVSPGRMRINSMYMDLNEAIETDFSSAPVGTSLMVLDANKNLTYVDDNLFQEKLVLAVVQFEPPQILVTPIIYANISGGSSSVPADVFSPAISVETQIRMLFDELSANKQRDSQLKYEETLESLPAEYNAVLIENFESTANFVSSELVYNPYSKLVSLGIVPPYPTDAKKLMERVVLPNVISKCYFMVDRVLNGQTCDVRFSLNDGVTWATYTGDDEYTNAGMGQILRVEFTVRTTSQNVTPVLRSWACFYNKL